MNKLELEDDTIAQLREILSKYKDLGYEELKITYSGSGDSGDVDEVYVCDEDKEQLNVDADERKFFEYDLVDTLMEQTGFSGYENNDGGQGTVIISLESGAIHVDHQTNYIETYDETADLTLFGEEDEESDDNDS